MGRLSGRVFCVGLLIAVVCLWDCAMGQQVPDVYIRMLSPALSKEEPAADGKYNIGWLDGDFGYISLYYDADREPGGEVLINPLPLPALEFKDYAWDTSHMPNLTEWCIVGKIKLSVDPSEPWIDTNYSRGTVYINRVLEPVIRVGPDADVTADRSVTLNFKLRGMGYYWLFYDVDRVSGGEGQITGPSSIFAYSDFTPGSFVWDTKDLPDGESYYIVGKTKTSVTAPAWSYSETSLGRVRIDHTLQYHINVLEPSGTQYVPVGDSFDVRWEDYDPNVTAYINIYTDTDIDNDASDDVRRTLLSPPVSEKTNHVRITFNDSNDRAGNTYYVIGRIKASNQGDGGETLAEGYAVGNIVLYGAQGQDTTAPAAVQDLIALPRGDGSAITLKWSAPGDDGNYGTAVSYEIRYSRTVFESDADFSNGTSVPYVDTKNSNKPRSSGTAQRLDITGLQLSTVYYFALKSTDDAGNQSPMSNIAWTNSMPVELSSFEAVPGLGRITLRWTTASETDALGWHVARCDRANGHFDVITSEMIPAAGTSSEPHSYSYTDSNVAIGITYYYKLVLYNLDGSQEESLVVSGSALAPPVDPVSDEYPLILAAGFMGSVISSSMGGELTIMAVVDPYTGSGEIEKVELYYMGIPAGILLYDDGTHGDDVAGDNMFHTKVAVEPGLAAGSYVLEIVATDTEGHQSPVFPYVTVR
ncbi:MAG: hypothetical protein JW759_07855 [Candidatus Coatesbacteria bacterium]|nr:hypothetical protein [Candidatus Coatesbacteria bacterium]